VSDLSIRFASDRLSARRSETFALSPRSNQTAAARPITTVVEEAMAAARTHPGGPPSFDRHLVPGLAEVLPHARGELVEYLVDLGHLR